MHEESLAGGNASGDVVRVGTTVRKPWTRSTPSVIDYMSAVQAAGVDVPETYGADERGRLVLEFIPGRLALGADPLTPDELARVGAMVRAIHDASARYVAPDGAGWDVLIPAPGIELVCHNDLAPWNLIVGERWVFIDWDAAGPSTRLWDLAYAAQAFTLSDVTAPPEHAAENLAAFVDGYDADPVLRRELPAAMHRRADAMHHLLRSSHRSGREPWGSMYAEGHGAHWLAATQYVERHVVLWAEAIRPRN